MHWEPKGVVLIIAPWNYPLSLVLEPLIGALAAGCPAVLKPSEITPFSADYLGKHLPSYLEDCMVIYNGGAEITQKLLDWPHWGLIFYTGGAVVGRIIQERANVHMIPTIMELGGKSPVVVRKGVDLEVVAKRIVFGKFFNAGQTCIAPDYILAAQPDELKEELVKAITLFYGMIATDSKDYCRISNERHWDRLKDLLDSVPIERVLQFGQSNRTERRFAPSIVMAPDPDSALMREEIFGPILPILPMDTLDGAIDFINSRDTPLAAYLFTADGGEVESFVRDCSAGGMTINDTMMHVFSGLLPLGGTGDSGHGRYKGRWSFEAFSHAKPVMWRSLRGEMINDWTRNPPMDETKFSYLSRAIFSPIRQ